MKNGALILARMNSSRCPGKVLRDLGGAPLIDRVVARARRLRSVDEIVVATTNESADDAVAEHCAAVGVRVFRGSAGNVARRVLQCVEIHGWSRFARINADSPFLDPWLIDAGVNQLVSHPLDLVTNVQPRSYPYGITVEVFCASAFRRGYRWMERPDDYEHVSRYFYRHADEFRIGYLPPADGDHSDVRLTIDTPEDLRRAAVLIERLGSDADRASWPQVVATYRAGSTSQGNRAAQLART